MNQKQNCGSIIKEMEDLSEGYKEQAREYKNVIIINLMTIFIDLARLVDKTIDLY